GDIMTVFEFSLSHMPYVTEWYVPVDDLMKIYVELYGTTRLPREVIVDCTLLLFAERFGEKLAIDKLYPDYAAKSPYLVDQLTDYFLGGLDDMAVWTQNVWREAIHMLDKGTDPSPRLQEALYLAEKRQEKHLLMKQEKQQKRLNAANQQSPDAVYSISNSYAKLGWSMAVADLDGDGNEDVVIGAPGYRYLKTPQAGAVFVVYGTDDGLPSKDLDLEHSADVSLPGLEYVNSRFGSSVAVLDINKDGVLDIAAGAPSAGSSTLTYQGAVFVYYGVGKRTFSLNMTVQCPYHYCNLGRTLTTADLNGDGFADLLMGSPFSGHSGDQRGIVSALLSDKKYRGYHAMITMDQLYWTATGSQNYSWFGHSLFTYAMGDGMSLVFISEPTLRKCEMQNCSFSQKDTQSIGQLNVFSTTKGKPLTLDKQFAGSVEFESFGASAAVGKPYPDGSVVLAVAATGEDVAGSVADIGTTFVQTGSVTLLNLTNLRQPPLAVFSGDRRFSRFGSKMLFADLNGDGYDDLLIGAPLRTDDVTEEIHAGEEGAAYVFFGGKTFPKGTEATSKCADFTFIKPCPGQSASAELVFGEDRARFGSGFAAVRSKTKVDVLVTALHSSRLARLSGAIAVYSFHHG
ncbi:hypothetical protein BaRGS_00024654, partial [Batillaria attramentaria]